MHPVSEFQPMSLLSTNLVLVKQGLKINITPRNPFIIFNSFIYSCMCRIGIHVISSGEKISIKISTQ